MSRNVTGDKLYKLDKKSTKKSTSVERNSKESNHLKNSFENRCSSTKNSNSKHITYIDIDSSNKKSSSRLYKKKTSLIPYYFPYFRHNNKTNIDINNDKDLSQGSIYKTNVAKSRKNSPPYLKTDSRNISPVKKPKGFSYEGILKELFESMDGFEKSTSIYSKVSEKYLHLLTIFERLKQKDIKNGVLSDRIDYYDRIWKNFFKLTIGYIENLEREEATIRKKFNDQMEKFMEFHSSYENEKNKYTNQQSAFKDEIQSLNKLISEKDKQLNEYHKIVKDLNKKLAIKEKCDTNEIYLYSQKQLLRDNKLLTTENKQSREIITNLEKEIEIYKNKELKMMKILYNLSRKGVAINDIVEKELNTHMKFNKLRDSELTSQDTRNEKDVSISINDSMYTPINIDPAKSVIKPDKVPSLNLNNLNNSFLNFASDDTTKKDKTKHTSHIKANSNPTDHNFSEIKDDSFSEKNLSQNNISQNLKEGYYPASGMTAMEKELFKTYKNITKDKNLGSNKSTMNNTDNNLETKSFSKKNSSNDSIKYVHNNEVKDSTNISEQDLEKLSINSNSWNFKNPINIMNLKDKLHKKNNITLFTNNNFNKNTSTKIKVKTKYDDYNKLTQLNTLGASDDKVVIDKRVMPTIENSTSGETSAKKAEGNKEQKLNKFMN